MRFPNVTSLYCVTPLAFNTPDGGVPRDDLRKILHENQVIAKVQMAKKYCRMYQLLV